MKSTTDSKEYFASIEYIPTATSTNTLLMEQDFANRTVIYTFDQTRGRGRLDRSWITVPNKSLALSVGLRNICIQPIWITAILSVATVNTLEKYGLCTAWIKWPNDIFVGQCKLAGILTESTWKNGKIDKCVAGVGINLNSTAEELDSLITNKAATSVIEQCGKQINLKDFTNDLLENIVNCLESAESGNISEIKQLWLTKTKLIGEKAKVSEIYKNSPTVCGTIENIDDDGFLYLNDGTKILKIVTGDIRIIL